MNIRMLSISISLGFIGILTLFLCARFSCLQGNSVLSINLENAISKNNIVDLLIIGSGPAGLQAAVYGGRAHLNTLVLEGREPGGLLTKTTLVENWPGEISILGPSIIQKLKAQALYHGAVFGPDTAVSVDFSKYPFEVKTEDNHTLYALSIIIATGATPKKLGIPGEETYWGMGVTTCAVCDAPFYKGSDVVVVGGGDSAVEEALQLAAYAKNITIMVRADAMRAAPSMQARLKGYSNIKVRYNVQVTEIHGDQNGVTDITVLNNKTNETQKESINGVFLAIGHVPNTWIFKGQIDLYDSGHVVVDYQNQQTSVPGVFVAGDVADKEFRQAGVAAGDGIKAALSASKFLMQKGYNEDLVNKLNKHRVTVYDQLLEDVIVQLESIADFETKVEKRSGLTIIDFYADYCPSCMQMLPVFNAVAHQYTNKVGFFKVDTEKAQSLVEKLHVPKVPCLLAFQDGKLVARYNTVMTKAELINLIEELLCSCK